MKPINNVKDLELGDGNEIYLEDLIYAIHNVSNKNCQWESLKGIFSPDRRIQTIESLFSHELYHQFRKIISVLNEEKHVTFSGKFHEYIRSTSNGKLLQRYSDLRIDTNIWKGFDNTDLKLKPYNSQGIKLDWKNGIYPDLVLHKGQDSDQHQKLIIEIKTTINLEADRIVEDLDKLLNFIEYFKFEFGVFIVVNNSPNEFHNKLKIIYSFEIAQQYKSLFEKIIVLCYDNENLTGGSLYKLLS